MIRLISSASLAMALALAAGSAFADTGDPSISVPLAGKDGAAIAAEVRAAAVKVCWEALRSDALGPEMFASCQQAAIDKAMANSPTVRAAFAPKPERLAAVAVER